MTNPPNERYHDLLDGPADPTITRLVGDLDTLYTATAPPTVRAALARTLTGEGRTAQSAPARRYQAWRGPLAPVAAVLAVAALVGGTALADRPLVDQVFGLFTGGADVASAPTQGQQVNLTQSACGYTMTINRVYGDANRVVVGYTITGPAGRTFTSFSGMPTLTDAWGKELHAIVGAGTATTSGTSGNATVFDASAVAATGGQLALRLSAPTIEAMETVTGTAPTTSAQPCERLGVAAQLDGQQIAQPLIVTTNFAADLTVPVTSSVRVADLNLTATSAHGTTVTLERVVVTPSETRLIVRGPVETELAGGPAIAPTLIVDGKEIGGGSMWLLGGGRAATSFGANLYDNHGDWQVKVLTDPALTNNYRSYTDAVIFHISVP